MTTQYIFGAIFILLGIYQLVKKDYLEVALYFLIGAAFILTVLTKEPRMQRFKTVFVVISWALIIAVAVLFIYMIQFKDISFP